MKNHAIRMVCTIALLASVSVWFGAADIARAQSYNSMSCGQLWYARNSIYAAKGYCFKSQQAINVFGRGCFPPYGKLSRSEQREVDLIRRVEAARGCSSSGRSAAPPQVQPKSGSYSRMSCGQLWYARNSIYAAKGYCFKSAQAQRAFPNSCFPPYGKLNGAEQREVATIKQWERQKGCQ